MLIINHKIINEETNDVSFKNRIQKDYITDPRTFVESIPVGKNP